MINKQLELMKYFAAGAAAKTALELAGIQMIQKSYLKNFI